MRTAICVVLCFVTAVASASAVSFPDCAGVIRVFGDAGSWFSSCIVIGDGSWAITTWDAITEKVGPEVSRTVRYPVFISPFSGAAGQCEVKAANKDLNVALLKLPMSGLPAIPFARESDFAKAAYRTEGQFSSGEPQGAPWPTEVFGVTRDHASNGAKLTVGSWNAAKAFTTDIGKYKWLFISDVTPEKAVPNGSMVTRGPGLVGMYLNKIVITGGASDVVYGRCAHSTEIAVFVTGKGVEAAALREPPAATVRRPDDAAAAFQVMARLYSTMGVAKPEDAVALASGYARSRPDDAWARLIHGNALNLSGKFAEALAEFDEAAKINPSLPTLRANRALALIGLGRLTDAEAQLKAAVDGSAGDSRPVVSLAEFYLADEKTWDKALEYADRAVSMAPDSPAVLLLKARVLKRMKNYQQALDAIGAAIKMAPDWGDAYFALGSTFEDAGDKEKAEKTWRLLAGKQPRNPMALLALASFMVDTGKTGEAREYIKKIRDLKPPQSVLDTLRSLEDKMDAAAPKAD